MAIDFMDLDYSPENFRKLLQEHLKVVRKNTEYLFEINAQKEKIISLYQRINADSSAPMRVTKRPSDL